MPLINEENRITAHTIEEAEDEDSVIRINRRLTVINNIDEVLNSCHEGSSDTRKEISMEHTGQDCITIGPLFFSPLHPHPSCIIDGAHAVSLFFSEHHPIFWKVHEIVQIKDIITNSRGAKI